MKQYLPVIITIKFTINLLIKLNSFCDFVFLCSINMGEIFPHLKGRERREGREEGGRVLELVFTKGGC